MGVSFKVSRKGTRFVPKPLPSDKPSLLQDEDDDGTEDPLPPPAPKSTRTRKLPVAPIEEEEPEISASEVSFTLSLFAEGYTIGSPSENDVDHQSSLKNVPKFLHPYDRASESIFSAIECGLLPGDILDDIPCKYVNGTLVCELQDYRKCLSQTGVNGPCVSNNPIVNRVRLRMSLENIIKDIPLISDSSWTYGDLMEVESRILKALQPTLCLDPTPNLDRLSQRPVSSKLNLGLSNIRRKRLRQIPEVNETSINGKKTCIDRMPESSNSRLGSPSSNIQQPVLDNMLVMRPKPFAQDVSVPASPMISQQQPKYLTVPGTPNRLQDHGAFNAPSSVNGQDMMNSYTDNISSAVSSLHGKRESQEAQLSKRSRLMGLDGGQQQHIALQNMDGFNGLDSQWKNALLQQQQQQHSLARGMKYANSSTGMQQKYPQQMYEGGFNNQESGSMTFNVGGQQYGLKEEPVEENRNKNDLVEAEINHMVDPQQQQLLQSRLQQRGGPAPPQQFMRSNFPQPWNGLGQNFERKEEQFSKRKVVQSPRVSAGGGLPQSPLSSKSGEFSSGSQFGGLSHKDKSGAVTSGANERQQQQQQQISMKRRTSSLPKTPATMSGIASPASVSNMAGVSFNASSPSVGTPPLADQIVLERFSKIEMLAVRYRLNVKKKNKKDEEYTSRIVYPDKQLRHHLSSDSSGEYIKDETCKMPLSKSLFGGSINVCKTRVLSFVQTERVLQGNGFSLVPKIRTRLIMSEKPNDGTVAMHCGEIEDQEYMEIEEYLPTLPSTHIADLLAAQFCSLMAKDGYHEEDHVQPKQVRPTNSQGGTEMQQQQNSDAVQPQTSTEMIPRTSANNNNQHQMNSVSQNNNNMSTAAGARVMLPPGNSQAAALQQHMSQGGLLPPSRSQQQNDSQQQPLSVQQQQQLLIQQQQHSQFQRSPLMLAGGAGANPLSQLNPNMQLGNQMMNKNPSAVQLQMFQQQQQQMQQQHQRKMMMGLGTVGGMGNNSNINNSMVGLQGLGNVMGMGGGGARLGTMGAAQGATMNLSQASTISNVISQQLRSGQLSAQQAAYMNSKLKMSQNRSTMLAGGVVGGGQSTISGMPARQMHPSAAAAAASGSGALSMLGSNLNRAANMNAMQQQQRTAMMGPPKLMGGMNPYMNQTQQQQQMQLQQQQQQMQHQQQLQKQQQQFQQQQQQETSALQSVVSSPQVAGSPSSAMVMQQASPQRMSQQRTPMSPQLSTGAMHAMSQEAACPASPQLSSQTIGSVAHSPMDLQPATPAPPVNNTTPSANP